MTEADDPRAFRVGLLYALAAYGSWGVVPLFWKQLGHVPSGELVAHRTVWSALAFAGLIAWRHRGPALWTALSTWHTARWFGLSALLIATNWFTYLYAVATDHIVEASLGYFINPLVNVLVGALVLRERLTRAQIVAVALATVGVILMARAAGGVPWLALMLAASFGAYGLVRKQAPADALVGSTLELGLLFAPALAALAWWASHGQGALGHTDLVTHLLLLGTGLVTAGPLLWFSEAARRLPLSTMGFFQYLSPTGQLLLGVLVYGEPFDAGRVVAFGVIWGACAVFTVDLVRRTRA